MTRDSIPRELIDHGDFDPADYMRRTRPELFSDTIETVESTLEASYFEYHLETLTSRNQEHEFEEFARRLAEVEICPNLRPQTGPTGGGDSKTDSSTYPVSQELCHRTYWGSPVQATPENWAFAFSCKKKWKPKVRDDVRKISTLGRDFQKVYFISNQFIRDKNRAETEQSLSEDCGFEVHILDRRWIVKCVIDHRREDIAIEALGLPDTLRRKATLGPRDAARANELVALLDHLSRPTEYYATDYLLSAAYRRAALLSRGLEKPRHEIDGLFFRACELAEKFGDIKQVINTRYDHAWTSLWWFNDPKQVANAYSVMETYLPRVLDTEDCNLFNNLLTLLLGSARMNTLSLEDARISIRIRALADKLTELADDAQRPNNALYAETLLWLMKLARCLKSRTVAHLKMRTNGMSRQHKNFFRSSAPLSRTRAKSCAIAWISHLV